MALPELKIAFQFFFADVGSAQESNP